MKDCHFPSNHRGAIVAVPLALALAVCSPASLASDGRIPIYQSTTITSPGSYYVTRDLTVSSGVAITIAADRVTVDLRGHTVRTTVNQPVISAVGFTNISVGNGRVEGGVYGIRFNTAGGHFQIDNVVLANQSGNGILITGTAGNPAQAVIEDNVVLSATAESIQLDNVRGAIVRDNEVRGQGPTLSGIRLSASSGNTVARNTITAVGSGAGIWLEGNSENNNISHNTLTENGAAGIFLDNSSNNTIEWNTTSENFGEGIYFFTGSSGNVYAFNRARNNSGSNYFPGTGNVDGSGNF